MHMLPHKLVDMQCNGVRRSLYKGSPHRLTANTFHQVHSLYTGVSNSIEVNVGTEVLLEHVYNFCLLMLC